MQGANHDHSTAYTVDNVVEKKEKWYDYIVQIDSLSNK